MDLPGLHALPQRRRGLLSGQPVPQQGRLLAEGGDVQDIEISGDAGADNAVVDGAPVLLRQALQAPGHPQHRAHVAGVAVRVPPGHRRDLHRSGEIAAAVEQGHGAHPGVGDDVAYALILVVAPVPLQHLPAGAPVAGALPVEGLYSLHHVPVGALLRKLRHRGIHNCADVRRLEGLGDSGAEEPGPPQAVAVVGDAGRRLAQLRRLMGLSGTHQSPGVDEDLAPDLLRQNQAVLLDGAGLGGGDAVFQVQVGGVLRAYAVAAPPIQAHPLPGVVEPGPGHVLGREGPVPGVVVQGAEKKHRAVGVVVGGEVFVFLDISGDVSVGVPDALVGPDGGLHRRAQADADVHAQKTGVDFFQIAINHGLSSHSIVIHI